MRSRRHHLDRPFALHADVDHPEAEGHTTAIELVGEVGPRRTGGAGDHPDAQRGSGHLGAPVGVEQPAGDETADDVVALQRHLAEREPRVEAAHLQAELPRWGEEVEVPEDAHLEPVAEAESVLGQDRAQPHAGVGEELHVDRRLAVVGLLDEAEVGVRAALAPALDLAADPHAVGEPPP